MKREKAEKRLAALAAEMRSAGLAEQCFTLDELAKFSAWPAEDSERRNGVFNGSLGYEMVDWGGPLERRWREQGRIYRAIRTCRWAHRDWHFARAETFEPMRCYVNSKPWPW